MRNPTPVPSTTPAAPVPLSITTTTLPPGDVLRVYAVPVTADHTHHLVVIAHGVTLDRAVEVSRHLNGPVRALLLVALGVPDPDTDPAGYAAARWWAPGQALDVALVEDLENAGQLTAWPHHDGAQAVTR
ncbi:hypothetical protein [Nocardiopsis dassonvillei]|uniref:hypothetical protein n=1 Tax=Nocardiopsis dassonvillei TaxID=2014 RepID=UPI0036304FFC